jgi:hypothetical protein
MSPFPLAPVSYVSRRTPLPLLTFYPDLGCIVLAGSVGTCEELETVIAPVLAVWLAGSQSDRRRKPCFVLGSSFLQGLPLEISINSLHWT